MAGRVFQINISDGGVPKTGCADGWVTELGVQGDRQIHTKVHGGPDRAVCLYSLERILELQAEGHPVFPGAMGENLTLSGVNWETLAPGMRMQVGQDVLLEITRYTSPCNSLDTFFLAGDHDRVSQKKFPGWSRVYTRVLNPGSIHIGDAVEIL